MTPEGKITKQIIDCLKHLKCDVGDRIWWFKIHGSPLQRAGVPDLLVIFKGEHIFFEIKQPGHKATQIQQVQIDRINSADGTAVVVHSKEEMLEILMEKSDVQTKT